MFRPNLISRRTAFFGAALLLCLSPLFALTPGRPRVTVMTRHFEITVDQNKREVLNDAAAWLENAYQIESGFFRFEPPERIQVVLLDEEDFSNGFAYSVNEWIVIYLPSLRFTLRGTTQWFPNVSAHELAHILTLRKMGLDSKFSGLDFFASWGHRTKRLEGDAAWIPRDVPPWLAEGLAQYGSMHSGFDTLDSHREMLLREAWNSGNLLPLKAMEAYSADSRSSEMIYNQGFHLVDYLYRTYGSEAVNAMMDAWQSRGYTGSFRLAFGASPGEVYSQWRTQLDVRYTNSEARPEALTLSEPPYTVEDAPVYDPETKTLYYLSSEANDFGRTHLYANTQNKGPRLLQLNVEPPLHLAPDGSLLYPAVRIDSKTGARFSDLYRYHPGSQSIEQITHQRRVIAGAATKRNEIYAILWRAGKTLIAQFVNGWMQQEINAPPGTEFMDLTVGDDSTLYVGAACGNNSDILRVNIHSRTITPVLASRHNERDPFVLNDRLYFSSDADGSYAVYSLRGNTLFRHTPPGPSAFSPSTDGKTLYFSAYTPHGFLLRSQPLDSGEALATLGLPTNSPFTPPPALSLTPGPDRTHLELVAYSANLGYARTGHQDYDLPIESGGYDTLRVNPCAQQGYAGGDGYWQDPAGRNELSASLVLGQCLDASFSPYSPFAILQYVNHNFAPDFFLQGIYQSVQIDLANRVNPAIGLESFFTIRSGLVFNFTDYIYDLVELRSVALNEDLHSSEYSVFTRNEYGVANTLGFSVVDRGMDFINRGILGSARVYDFTFSGGGNSSSGLTAQANLELHGNLARTLFLTASGTWVTREDAYSDAAGTLAGDVRLPEGLTLGGVGYRGFYLESIFLHAAYSAEEENGNDLLSLTQPSSLASKTFLSSGVAYSGSALNPPYLYDPGIPVPRMMELGIRLKTITPSSRVAMWNFSWQALPTRFKDGYFSVSVSL